MYARKELPLNGPDAIPANGPNVLNRLQALFGSNNAEAGPSRRRIPSDEIGDGLHRALTEPVMPVHVPKSIPDRDALLVKLVTWNMGDSLPKGDLSVLLGEVPEYSPLEVRDGLPIVTIGDSHPYHIIVVAGQECPTESGAPRGIGGGLIRGMKLQGLHHHKKGKEKEKDEESRMKEQEERDESSDSTIEGRPGCYDEGETSAESMESSRATTPVMASSSTLGSTSSLPRPHVPGSRGWSNMLDDWLCGAISKAKEGEKARSVEVNPISPPPPSMTHLTADPPSMHRSSSAPMVISASLTSNPSSISQQRSPLSRSPSSFISSRSMSDSDSSASEMEATFQMPQPAPKAKIDAEQRRANRPQIVIPTDEPPRAMEGSKCYVHLTKQRLMGMYLSVYVHKDCRHLVSGVDKDFVTAGLAGGRLGNKGGIGISINMADHRMLFVNSHLAAHTARNSARMANIAKIKSELSLDCFLPKDDPRATAKDLTDRFDSVFWCGDLNFRLDVARLHAEWLVEQKKYEEALTWDQLRNAMMDPTSNPFTGFQEGTIDFPPTFKYDVWHSVKTTNKNIRRSLRRRNSASKPRTLETGPGTSAPPVKVLDYVPEADIEDGEEGHTRPSLDEIASIRSTRQSYESSRSVLAETGRGDRAQDEAERNGQMNAHRPLEAKLKEKTKHIMQLVKIKTHLSPSPSISRRPSVTTRPTISTDLAQASRRTSMSSITSTRDREYSPETPSEPRPFGLMDSALLSPIEPKSLDDRSGIPRRPSVASSFGSPQRPGRAFSLKRTLSGKSMRPTDVTDESEQLDMRKDRREGVYDSSKKQRVPSWCDRVLWKAHSVPDLPESASHELESEVAAYQARPRFGRITEALLNVGLHLKSPVNRTMSIDTSQSARSRTPPLSSSHRISTSPDHTLVNGVSPTSGTHTPPGQVPRPKSNLPAEISVHTRGRPISSDPTHPASPKSPTRHPLLQTGGSQSGSPARPHITIDPTAPASHDHVAGSRSQSGPIPSINGLGRDDPTTSSTRPTITPMRRLTGEPAPAVHTTQLITEDLPPSRTRSGSGSGLHSSGLRNWGRSLTLHASDQVNKDGERENHDSRNKFTRFIHDIPNWLHRHHASTTETEVDIEQPAEAEPEVPKRHLQGEVVCLHYGTIDDAGMRLLEGRSDHRPAIFAAAIYI